MEKPKPKRTRRISVFIDEDTWMRLRKQVFEGDQSMSEICYDAIVAHLEHS